MQKTRHWRGMTKMRRFFALLTAAGLAALLTVMTSVPVMAAGKAARVAKYSGTGSFAAAVATGSILQEGDFSAVVLKDGTVRITGYRSGSGRPGTIPDRIGGCTVSEIGENALAYGEFEELVIPDSVRYIGENAFEYAEISKSIAFPEGIVIGSDAFEYALLPEQMTLPAGTEVQSEAFSYCEGLEELILKENVVLGPLSFEYAEDVESIVIAPGCRIGERAFEYADSLKTVTCAGGGTDAPGIVIGSRAFGYCRRLETVIIDENTSVAEDAFSGCRNVKVTGGE